MYAHRLSLIFVATVASFTGVAQAQGPWPTNYQPSFFSPMQEFFTPRSYSTNYSGQPTYNQYPSTTVVPGVPQCANGRCRSACPNGQCGPSNSCANGQCARPSQSFFQPFMNSNGSCANGQCRNQNGFNSVFSNNSSARPALPNSSLGFRPLSPIQPNNQPPTSGRQLNRLVPLDGGYPVNNGLNPIQRPLSRNRETMLPSNDFANDPTVRLQ
jgi:hypothetical protein